MDDGAILFAHTATRLADARGRVVVCGSHGGAYVGLLAAAAGVRAVILNDAGIGRDEAGIAGLPVCADHGVAAAAVSHATCRIGDAGDTWARGTISAANALAAACGVVPGVTAREAAVRLAAAPGPAATATPGQEHRTERRLNGHRLLILDSHGLVQPGKDDGAIIVTGSHGGLVGGDPASAGRAEARLFAFNDAGVGLDTAGIARLPALQARGLAAVCVDCFSARIGEALSTLEGGVVSHANAPAIALGAVRGRRLADVVADLAG